jgi:diguanylate cyclase (GGDEF)-like protein
MQNKKFIFSMIVLVFILPLLGGCSSKISFNQPRAKEGVLDLSQCRLDQKVVNLDGQWEFYWKQLLEPEDLNTTSIDNNGYIETPSSWNHHYINGEELPGEGYATYRLKLITGEQDRLAIKIPRIFTAYKLWVNEELIASSGTVGQNRDTMTPQYLPQVACFDAQPGENQIVIQVSNFYHRSGGMLESLTLGNEKLILDLRYKNVAYELVLFGCLIIIGAYHLVLFFFRRQNPSTLYFGLFCIFVGIRTLLVGERFFIYLFPGFNWEIAHKIQTLTFYLGVPLIVMFFKSIFPKDINHKICKVIVVVGILFGGLVLLTPAKIFTLFNPVYQLFCVAVIIYLTYVFLRKLGRKEKYVGLVVAGGLALFITSLNDIVFASIWLNDSGSTLLRTIFKTDNLTSVGQLLFVFTISLVLAKQFAEALEKEKVMTLQLTELNLNLDQLVKKRTEALEESGKQIESQKLELEKTNQALQLLSLKDPLTGLWNRRKFDEIVEMEWNRSLRNKRPLSLMVIDIDLFKGYNDRYGHWAGDETLVQVAQTTINSFKRAGDLVTRYGGEEFLVIMPETDKDDAIKMAMLLCKKIEDLHIPYSGSTVSQYLTVSIGVTTRIPDINSSPKDLFLIADKALYQAKAAGRNQVKFLSE